MKKNKLEQLKFVNNYYKLPDCFYKKVVPENFSSSYLISYNKHIFDLLQLDINEVNRPEFIEYFSGQRLLPEANPLATSYAGHQFGHYAGMLGDGRALLLGEIENPQGKWEINSKGSGQTPYSRGFDGHAVLRSSIREYLASHAMQALSIPTTHALCLIGTGEKVKRETLEKGAIVIRVAESFIRFGTFELFYYQGLYDKIKILADFVIENYYKDFQNKPDKYLLFFAEIVKKTAKLIASWMAVGFTHGVLNTDNMSILGLTIDYGPYGFMDKFNFDFIPNHSDKEGRYSYRNQPYIGFWNLKALSVALSPLIASDDLQKILDSYYSIYKEEYLSLMRKKLGLISPLKDDHSLIIKLLNLMHENEVDYTIFFRKLCNLKDNSEHLEKISNKSDDWKNWLELYKARLDLEESEEGVINMNNVNPKYILKNHLAETAIAKANEGDYKEIDKLLEILSHPYNEQKENEIYSASSPSWAENICISCSS